MPDSGPQQLSIRRDLSLIADLIDGGARVLDVGCGDGALLEHLERAKDVDGRGIELSMDGVRNCVARGLSVIQGDADTDLKDYPSDSFDYVVLSQTLQAMRDPKEVLGNLVRIGRHAIVSLPNFGHWRVRTALLLHGRMPKTDSLPHAWWATPNIHVCTIADFVDLTRDMGVRIDRSMILSRGGRQTAAQGLGPLANWFGEQGIFLLSRR